MGGSAGREPAQNSKEASDERLFKDLFDQKRRPIGEIIEISPEERERFIEEAYEILQKEILGEEALKSEM